LGGGCCFATIDGGIESSLIVTDRERVPPSFDAVQVNVVPDVWNETVWSPQPEIEVAAVTVQLMNTGLRFQPAEFGAGDTDTLMVGAAITGGVGLPGGGGDFSKAMIWLVVIDECNTSQ
jgi:hypothetical protein